MTNPNQPAGRLTAEEDIAWLEDRRDLANYSTLYPSAIARKAVWNATIDRLIAMARSLPDEGLVEAEGPAEHGRRMAMEAFKKGPEVEPYGVSPGQDQPSADLTSPGSETPGWRTMGSAPRDGTPILAYNSLVGVYNTSFVTEPPDHASDEPYAGFPCGFWPSTSDPFGRWYCEPSHWRPIPSRPGETATLNTPDPRVGELIEVGREALRWLSGREERMQSTYDTQGEMVTALDTALAAFGGE